MGLGENKKKRVRDWSLQAHYERTKCRLGRKEIRKRLVMTIKDEETKQLRASHSNL